jgi:xanthine dehydrogenase small subunit
MEGLMTAYFRPKTLAEALEIRASRDVMPLAGGTDVYPVRTARRAWGDPTHKDVLDLSGLGELDGIDADATHVRFGALTTWTDLTRADLPALFDGYRLAARAVGGVQVQNSGTLVGNIVTASPAGDGIPNLMALDAEVELASLSGRRRLPIRDFVTGYRQTALRPDELVSAIIVPRRENARSHFLKLGARAYLVISIAMVAGTVTTDEAGLITEARIAVGACSAVAERLGRLESELVGLPLAEAAAHVEARHLSALSPIDDVRASGAYRRAAATTLVRDLLTQLATTTSRRAA